MKLFYQFINFVVENIDNRIQAVIVYNQMSVDSLMPGARDAQTILEWSRALDQYEGQNVQVQPTLRRLGSVPITGIVVTDRVTGKVQDFRPLETD